MRAKERETPPEKMDELTEEMDQAEEQLEVCIGEHNPWLEAGEDLIKRVGPHAFKRWFANSTWHVEDEGIGCLSIPSDMHQVWIETNYLTELFAALTSVDPSLREVKIRIDESLSVSPCKGTSQSTGSQPQKGHSAKGEQEQEIVAKRAKACGLNPSHTFASFVVGANSQFAHAACEAVAKKSAICYNPLYIYGGSGLGKTHLMQAIGHQLLARQPNARVVYLTTEKFINEFIETVRRGEIEKFRRRYRNVDALLVDDVQFFIGKERSQEEFFHTFNSLFDGKQQIVIACDRPASELKSLAPRLISRFECGMTVELQPPQVETRMAILRKKASDWKVRLDDEILQFLSEKIHSNVRRLEGALMRVATFASLAGESVTIEKIEPLLIDLLHEENSRQITIDTIQKAVAEYYDVRVADMTSRRRPNSIAFPRQIAMYLSRSLTKNSLIDIGEAFGGRDHGTVIHAYKKVVERIKSENDVKEAVARIESQLRR